MVLRKAMKLGLSMVRDLMVVEIERALMKSITWT
jgi:hypothetical protein